MAASHSDSLRVPDLVLPATVAGFVAYREKRLVGFQFVAPDGQQIFVPMPGWLVERLGDDAYRLFAALPEARTYGSCAES